MNNFYLNNDKDLNSQLMKAISIILGQKDNSGEIIEKAFNKETNQFNFNVDFKINGEEYDFKNFLSTLIGRLDIAIEREAKQLLQDKVYKISNLLDKIEDNIDDLNLEVEKELEKGWKW